MCARIIAIFHTSRQSYGHCRHNPFPFNEFYHSLQGGRIRLRSNNTKFRWAFMFSCNDLKQSHVHLIFSFCWNESCINPPEWALWRRPSVLHWPFEGVKKQKMGSLRRCKQCPTAFCTGIFSILDGIYLALLHHPGTWTLGWSLAKSHSPFSDPQSRIILASGTHTTNLRNPLPGQSSSLD